MMQRRKETFQLSISRYRGPLKFGNLFGRVYFRGRKAYTFGQSHARARAKILARGLNRARFWF